MPDVGTLSLNECLQKFFGFDTFKGQQETIIKSLLDKKDTINLYYATRRIRS